LDQEIELKLLNIAALTLAAGLALGCSHKTDRMGRTRPAPDELADGGRGLQGKDVISASDQMAQSLLTDPALNASPEQWTIVVDHVDNMSVTQKQNLDIFLLRLKSKISQLGKGRVALFENRAKLRELQARELERGGDRFGQGGVPAAPPGRIEPKYALYAKLAEMPNRETSYFLVEFTLVDLKTGAQPWDNIYEVTTNR
jgi:hypothetical protein